MSGLDRLSPRERGMIGIAAATLALFAGWTFAWQPLMAGRDALEAEIMDARTLMTALRQAPDDAPAEAAPAIAAPVSVRLTRSAESVGITLARIEPQGDGLTATVDEAPFDDVLAWIAAMEDTERMRLTAIEIDRRPEPGTVSVRLTLAPQDAG